MEKKNFYKACMILDGEKVSEEEKLFNKYFLSKISAIKYAQRYFAKQPLNAYCDHVFARVIRVTITNDGNEQRIIYRKIKNSRSL